MSTFLRNGKALKIYFTDGSIVFADFFSISTRVNCEDSQCHSSIRFFYNHVWYLRRYESAVRGDVFYRYLNDDELSEISPTLDENGNSIFESSIFERIEIVDGKDVECGMITKRNRIDFLSDPHEDVNSDKKSKWSNVLYPNHYNQNGIEVWDVINAFTKDLEGAEAFYAGNVIKYVLRWNHKNGIEDLEKAKVYIDKIIEGRK